MMMIPTRPLTRGGADGRVRIDPRAPKNIPIIPTNQKMTKNPKAMALHIRMRKFQAYCANSLKEHPMFEKKSPAEHPVVSTTVAVNVSVET